MTPLIAGIALQGSPPMYEGFVKAKEAAKAKAGELGAKRGAQLRDMAYDGFDFDAGSFHPHVRNDAADTYLTGMASILDSIDPNDPNNENKIMYQVVELQKELAARKGMSDVLYSIEDPKWQDRHLMRPEVVEWFNENEIGAEVPEDLKGVFSDLGINYMGGGIPSVQVSGHVKHDYIKDYVTIANKAQGEWASLPDQEKRKRLGNRTIDVIPEALPFELAQPVIEDMALNDNAWLNIKFKTGIDIRTPEGQLRFYQNYNPSKKLQMSGSRSSRGGGRGSDDMSFLGEGEDQVINLEYKDGKFEALFSKVQILAGQSNVNMNMQGALNVGESGFEYTRASNKNQTVEVVEVGELPVYTGNKSFTIPAMVQNGESVGPFDIRPGDVVPEELRGYISQGKVDGVTEDDLALRWYFKAEGSEEFGEKKSGTETLFIPVNKSNAYAYLNSLPIKERRAEAERFKALRFIDGEDMNKIMRSGQPSGRGSDSPAGGSPKGGGKPSSDGQRRGGTDNVGEGIF